MIKWRWAKTIAGLILGFISPILMGGLIAEIQSIHMQTFIWNVLHQIPFYNSFYQFGIAINIGIFFLIMKNDNAIFFGRGWLVATVLSVLWTLMIELNGL
ncbi:MAG: hypothetical protein KG003_16260 [Bacteroidetes bacterium]|nr:hypothetical protein [Bacteroidota bacterium]